MEQRAGCPDTRPLTPGERAFIGDAWLRDGLAEHASVASFARFALLGLKLGAPPSILSETARAMEDEIRHAKLCFSVASKFLDRELGPGKLDIGTMDEAEQSAEAILAATIVEGCVGETIAAAIVRRAGEEASHPELKRILEEIAPDEQRHSDLAWNFAEWMLASRASLGDAARKGFGSALAFAPDDEQDEPFIAIQYGVLPLNIKREVRKQVIDEIILPRAASLLDLSFAFAEVV